MELKPFSPELLEKYREFSPVVDPNEFIGISIKLLLVGFIIVVAFLSYEVTHTTIQSRSIVKEFTLASSASITLGAGILFAMLGAGLYV